MKMILTSLGFLFLAQVALAGRPVILQGKVKGATGVMAQAGWTDCQVKVSSQSEENILVDFSLINSQTGAQLVLQNLNLTKAGRVGLFEKMKYDFGARTALQTMNDSRIIPPAYSQYNNLVKVRRNGTVLEYHFAELVSNGEFYQASSELFCLAH